MMVTSTRGWAMDRQLSRVAARQASRIQGAQRRVHGVVQGVILFFVALALLTTVGTSAYIGWSITHPARRVTDDSPARLKMTFDTVEFPSVGDRVTLRGWFIPAAASDQTVILAHGYGGNRLEKAVDALDLAQALSGAGYNVLMFDFRNSGLSDGRLTTFGYRESDDILGAVRYLQGQHREQSRHLAVMGFSMGGVAAARAAAEEPALEAVVMDSPYVDLPTYLDRNMKVWSGLPRVPFNWLVRSSLRILGRIPVNEVNTASAIRDMSQPVLVLYGKGDTMSPAADREALARAGGARVQIWEAPGSTPSWPSGVLPADSPACYNLAGREADSAQYDGQVIAFLKQHVGKQQPAP